MHMLKLICCIIGQLAADQNVLYFIVLKKPTDFDFFTAA